MASVQRLMLYTTPVWLLDMMARIFPKTVIGLFCHWINEKNINVEERKLAPRKPTLMLPVAKKMSQLSTVNILNLLKQDGNLWKLYMAGTGMVSLAELPYVLLELMYDLGGPAGKTKVLEVVQRSRQTLGGRKQGDIMENFKVDTVIDMFENFPEGEVRMRLAFSTPEAVAFWLDHWDMKRKRCGKPGMKSAYWLGQLSGERAYKIQLLMRDLEFRKKYEIAEGLYGDYRNEWKEFTGKAKE
jgi:hypothetical protein